MLAATLPLAADGTAQLLPFGSFAARDGRPGPGKTFKVDNERGAMLAAEMNRLASQTPIVIDYDHQTIHTITNGQPAPASGWMNKVEWRDNAGLFASVEWTKKARAFIDEKEYRFISPVLVHDADGTVTGVLLAALVNYPALTGMEPVFTALSSIFGSTEPNPQESSMNLLVALAAILGTQALTEAQAIEGVTALKARADTKAPVPTALSAALGLSGAVDEAAALSAIASLKSGDATALTAMQGLQEQVVALSTQINEGKVTGLVDAAITAKKLLPAQRDWAMSLGKSNIEALNGYLATAQPIPGLGGQGGGIDPNPGAGGAAALSATQAAVAAQLGIDPVKYAESMKTAA